MNEKIKSIIVYVAGFAVIAGSLGGYAMYRQCFVLIPNAPMMFSCVNEQEGSNFDIFLTGNEDEVCTGSAVINGKKYEPVTFAYDKTKGKYELKSGSELLFEGPFGGVIYGRVVIGDKHFLVAGGDKNG